VLTVTDKILRDFRLPP